MDRQYNDQKFEDSKVVISKSMDRQYNNQKFEDNKVVISRSMDRQYKRKRLKRQWSTKHYTEN